MAFKKGTEIKLIDFANLIVSLNKTGLNLSNQPLYQTIKGLIDKSQQSVERQTFLFQSIVGDVTIDDSTDLSALVNSIVTINAILNNSQFLVAADESINLPNSRQLVAGTNITFDDTIVNVRTINAIGGGGSGISYIPLSLGVEPLTFMSDGLGQPMLIPFVP